MRETINKTWNLIYELQIFIDSQEFDFYDEPLWVEYACKAKTLFAIDLASYIPKFAFSNLELNRILNNGIEVFVNHCWNHWNSTGGSFADILDYVVENCY